MADAAPPVLAVRDLTKTYRSMKKAPGLSGAVKALVRREHTSVTAVTGLSFDVRRGEFVGLLGPNGAGKTTTLKMLTGLIRPSAGRATAFGEHDTAARRPAYLRRIGLVMGQRNQLNADLPAIDSFRLAQAIYDLPEARFQARLDLSLALFGLRALVTTPVRKLSLGERMKMELILALLHEPELLFLDEPTIGLDFNAARHIRGFLAEANRKLGVTVILTSHYAKDIEELCRRVVLINHGRVVYDGPLVGMDPRVKGRKTVTMVLDAAPSAALARAALTTLARDDASLEELAGNGAGADEASAPPAEDATHALSFAAPTARLAQVLAHVTAAAGAERVVDLRVAETPLDEIFAALYRKPNDAEAAG
jgi:ABC-2 type transport system ATP-binding protein